MRAHHWHRLWQVDNIPKMKHAGILDNKEMIAHMLFGDDCYVDPDETVALVKPELLDFVGALLSYLWNQAIKATKNQILRLQKGKLEVMTEYESKL
jgi:hypothetical protein